MNRPSTKLTPANISVVRETLRGIPDELEQWQNVLTREQLNEPMAEGERSPRRVLAHILNCESYSFRAIHFALLLDTPFMPRIHAERDWAKLTRYEQFSYADMLSYFRFRRRALMSVLDGLDEKGWGRAFQPEGRKKPDSVWLQARGMAIHEREHLVDLREKLGCRGISL